jgi:hypothetical protein
VFDPPVAVTEQAQRLGERVIRLAANLEQHTDS